MIRSGHERKQRRNHIRGIMLESVSGEKMGSKGWFEAKNLLYCYKRKRNKNRSQEVVSKTELALDRQACGSPNG